MMNFLKEPPKLNKKRIIILVAIIILIIAIISVIITYINNKSARDWIDKNIFRKEVTQNNLPKIDIEEINTSNIYAFNKYIGILDNNNFEIYDNAANKASELTIEITTPIFNSNGRYLAIGEQKGQKLYLIEDKSIKWETDIEGDISSISVNSGGYVAVTIVDTNYKTVIMMFDNKGEALFKTFLSSTRVIATSISDDNKYLSLAEVDTSGTVAQSRIKVISIEKGKTDPENSIVKTYEQNNSLIVNIKYQEKNKLLCMYTDKITEIKQDAEEEEQIKELSSKNTAFASIELSNSVVTVQEKSSGLFTADSEVSIINSSNQDIAVYTANSVTKEIYTADNVIALNLGSEVELISTNGWLVKRYTAEQEITGIVLSNSVAGIIYRNKIEIVNL